MGLHVAAFNGDVHLFTQSLREGAQINEASETVFSNACSTPLHIAAQHGHVAVVEACLKAGADAIAADCWGHTAAHLAALEGYASVLEVLLKHSVDVLRLLDEQERTPLHIAAQAGNTDCVSVLLKYGAHADAVHPDAAEQSVPLASVLHSAAASGSADALKMLLAAFGNSIVNAVDSFERTPLHVAASNAHVECVKVLLEAGANVHAKNSWGATALHLAARKRSPAVMHLLLKGGASIDAADNHSMSALHYSAQASCLPSMQLLLANRASVNVLSSLSETPLSLAAHAYSSNSNSLEAISMLLTAGASLSCLHKMFPDLDPAAQALLQAHVRRTSIATAASIRAICAQKQEACRGAPLDLCGDVVHLILAKSLDVEDEFLRLLLNGRGEECCVLA